jgi:AcrR family transcriptional regulator
MVIKKNFILLLKEMPLNKITVTKICEMSEINRATFYKYYDDPFDLLDKIENDLLDEVKNIVENQATHKNLTTTFQELLEVIKDKGDLYTILFSVTNNNSFPAKLLTVCYKQSIESIAHIFPNLSESQQEWLYYFTAGGCSCILKCWVNNGMKEPINEIADYISRLNTILLKNLQAAQFDRKEDASFL